MSNRISHFFFTNNTPTGVNYTSPILSSVVYHDGAEYPYLPGLPFYNGQALDNLPNLGFVGGCTDKFNRVARGHEQNLVDWNERFIQASYDYNERNVDIILTWAFQLSMALGIGDLLQGAYDWITGELGTAAAIAAQKEEADKLIARLVKQQNEVPVEYARLKRDLDAAKLALEADTRSATIKASAAMNLRRSINNGGLPPIPGVPPGSGWLKWEADLNGPWARQQLQKLEQELQLLTGDRFWTPGKPFFPNSNIGRTLRVIEDLTKDIGVVGRFAIEGIAQLKLRISNIVKDSKNLTKNISWSAKLISGLPKLFIIIFAAIAKVLSVLSIIGLIAIILAYTYELLDNLSKVCSESETKLKEMNKEKEEFYKNYIKSVESLLQEGCCDIKPCDPPTCPNGQKHCPDAEGNCAPCESGSGSGSNTLGVGLQLLLEIDGGSITKYIPVTVVGDGNGSGGGGGGGGSTTSDHKPLCEFAPRRNGEFCPPTPKCKEMEVLHYGPLYQNYINDLPREDKPTREEWLRGTTTEHPPGVDIPNPKTACNDINFVFDFGLQCSAVAPLYDSVVAALSSLIPTGGTDSQTRLNAIREQQNLFTKSRGVIN
jgi:hypothetical protein